MSLPQFTNEQLGLAAAAGLGVVALYVATRKPARRMPPGPKPAPVIGNLLSWPSKQPWLQYTQWREEYGDLVYGNVAGTSILVINSMAIAKDLLDDRGNIYSDRPHLHFADSLIGWADSPIMCTANHPHFKPGRRIMHTAVGTRSALESYIHMEEHEVHRFLHRVAEEPAKFEPWLRKLSGTIILRVLYGYDVKPGPDEYVDLIEQVNADLNKACTPGNYMVDLIPALEYVPAWFPGAGWKRQLKRMRATLNEVLTKPVNFVKQELAAGTAQASSVGNELLRPDYDEARDRSCLAWSSQALYTGGADTSTSIACSVLLCLTLHPEFQAKGQAEVDRVIGHDILPKYEDRTRLPYVDAILKEVLRWTSVAPQALPHCTSADDEYKGYFIPKGTIIIPNVWGYSRDPNIYKNPDIFNPDRFMGPKPEMDPREYVFGFGRRVCPGRQLGEASLFLLISGLLATLNVTKKIGPDGKPIEPKVNFDGGAVVYPEVFVCDIKPRNARAEALIHSVDDTPYGH